MCLACKDGRRRNHGRRLEWCRSGRHELTPDNLILRSDGTRICKACRYEYWRARPKRSAEYFRTWRSRKSAPARAKRELLRAERRAERERSRLLRRAERDQMRRESREAAEQLLDFRQRQSVALETAYAEQDGRELELALANPELAQLIAKQARDQRQFRAKFGPSYNDDIRPEGASRSRRSRKARRQP
jgi:hypothetical protein